MDGKICPSSDKHARRNKYCRETQHKGRLGIDKNKMLIHCLAEEKQIIFHYQETENFSKRRLLVRRRTCSGIAQCHIQKKLR